MYDSWVKVDKSKHEQRGVGISYGRSLPVGKVLNILNHVLATMYDIGYGRNGVERIVNGARMHEYAPKQSSMIHRKGSPYDVLDKVQSRQPCIAPWLLEPLKDLSLGQLVELNLELEVIQTGAAYANRQGDNTARLKLRPMQRYDIGETESDDEGMAEDLTQKRKRDEAAVAVMGFTKKRKLQCD